MTIRFIPTATQLFLGDNGVRGGVEDTRLEAKAKDFKMCLPISLFAKDVLEVSTSEWSEVIGSACFAS